MSVLPAKDDDAPKRMVMTLPLALAIVQRIRDGFEQDDAGEERTMPDIDRERLEVCCEYLWRHFERKTTQEARVHIDILLPVISMKLRKEINAALAAALDPTKPLKPGDQELMALRDRLPPADPPPKGWRHWLVRWLNR